MRSPVWRITTDDPADYAYPMAADLANIAVGTDEETLGAIAACDVGQSVLVGGGASPLFEVTRIR